MSIADDPSQWKNFGKRPLSRDKIDTQPDKCHTLYDYWFLRDTLYELAYDTRIPVQVRQKIEYTLRDTPKEGNNV